MCQFYNYMKVVAPHTLHNELVKYCFQLELEWLFIKPTSSCLFFLTVVIPKNVLTFHIFLNILNALKQQQQQQQR